AYWEDDADFSLDWHVRHTALPGQAGKADLQRLVSLLASTPLDHARPLWQFHLVERYQGGSALVARIHHCYADGIALIQVLLSLTDTTPRAAPGSALSKAWLKRDGERVTSRFFDPARAGLDRAVALGSKALGKGMELYQNPTLAAVLAREGGEIARELA